MIYYYIIPFSGMWSYVKIPHLEAPISYKKGSNTMCTSACALLQHAESLL